MTFVVTDPRVAPASADWLITGVGLWTGVGQRPDANAIAIQGGRIMAVGSVDELEGLRGRRTAVLSLEGRFVVPGFVDAHVHIQSGGLQLFRVDMRGADSPEAFIRRVADWARITPGQGWILGADWDHQLWGGELPSRQWLDHAAPGRPVFLSRRDMHMGVASSRALELAGIGAATAEPATGVLPATGFADGDPASGLIDRDPATGEPTGILRERAMEAISRVVPPPSREERRSAIRSAAMHALARGVTQLHDMGALQSAEESWQSLHTLRSLRHEGLLPVRVSAAVPVSERFELLRFIEEVGRGDERLRWGTVKGFVDGSLGSSTAWFHEPYHYQPENHGAVISDLDELAEGVRESVRAGLQPAVHAIGDRANDWLLDLYEGLDQRLDQRLDGAVRGREVRPRMEHVQHLTPEGVRRAAASGAVLSMQPLHLVDDGRSARHWLGEEREARSFAFRSLIEGGGSLAFGSDWTVAPIDPIGTLQAAVTRRIWEPAAMEWGEVWVPDERLSLEQALRAQTIGAARAAYFESETGTLEPGKRADLTILSDDPFAVDPDSLRELVHVEMTFVDGVLAHRTEDLALGAST